MFITSSGNLSCPPPLFSSKVAMFFLLLCKHPRCSIEAFITLYFTFLFSHLSLPLNFEVFKAHRWDFPSGPMAKTLHSQCSRLGSIPGQGTRSHMLQLKILHSTTKTRSSQMNKYFKDTCVSGL